MFPIANLTLGCKVKDQLLLHIFTCENVKIYKRLYFTCENIEYNLITSAFTVDFPQPTSDVQSKAQHVGIHLLNWIVSGLLV